MLENEIFTDREFSNINSTGCTAVAANFLCSSPFAGYNYYIAEKYPEELIRALRFAARAFRAGRAEVILPAGRENIISVYSDRIQRLPNIFMRIVKDRYPAYKSNILKRQLYKCTEINKENICSGGVLLIAPFKLLQIFYAVTEDAEAPDIDRAIITEKGSYVLSATRRETVKAFLEKANQPVDGFLIRDSLLNGKSVVNPEIETISDTRVFFIMQENPISLSNCISCGKCARICPAGLNRPYSFLVLERKKGLFSFKEVPECMKCGLCGFFCPGFKD